MRVVLIPILGLACIAASGEREAPTLSPEPRLPARDGISTLDSLLAAEGTIVTGEKLKARQDFLRENCRDRLERTHDSDEIPVYRGTLFNRDLATPEEPMAIYAVDRRENGCGMMVMMGNPEDVRPLPSLSADDHRLMPADGNED